MSRRCDSCMLFHANLLNASIWGIYGQIHCSPVVLKNVFIVKQYFRQQTNASLTLKYWHENDTPSNCLPHLLHQGVKLCRPYRFYLKINVITAVIFSIVQLEYISDLHRSLTSFCSDSSMRPNSLESKLCELICWACARTSYTLILSRSCFQHLYSIKTKSGLYPNTVHLQYINKFFTLNGDYNLPRWINRSMINIIMHFF